MTEEPRKIIIVAANYESAIQLSRHRLGEVSDGMEITAIEATRVAPDLFAVTWEKEPFDPIKRAIESSLSTIIIGGGMQ